MVAIEHAARLRGLFALCAVLLYCGSGFAQTPELCVKRHFQAQELREKGQLLDAESALSECASASCPGVIQTECSTWMKELSGEIPSLVVAVTNEEKEDVLSFQLIIDGRESSLDQRGTVRLDPGEHEVEVRAQDYQTATRIIQMRPRELMRREDFILRAVEKEAPVVEFKRPPTWPLWALGGISLAGAGAFGFFASDARSREREMAADCEPNCTDEEIERTRKGYMIANVSLGIAGVAALAGGGYLIYWSRNPSSKKAGETGARRSNAWGVGFSGEQMVFRGSF